MRRTDSDYLKALQCKVGLLVRLVGPYLVLLLVGALMLALPAAGLWVLGRDIPEGVFGLPLTEKVR